MQAAAAHQDAWDEVERLAQAVVALGVEVGLPFVAAQSDLGDPEPMADAQGRAYAERLPWVERGSGYWRDRRLALKSTFLGAARVCSEPIWYADGRLGSWRPTRLFESIDVSRVAEEFGFRGAVIAPVHLPAGRIGAVVWVTSEPVDMPLLFALHAERMFTLAYRFLAAHAELSAARRAPGSAQLSAREAQCVRWAAAGKTNAEIGTILSLSVSTVRFHLRNAGAKLGAATRARMIQAATGQGYLGSGV
jgi:DNA-binding CsgD family transcriptional regulator